MKHREHDLQVACVRWFKLSHHELALCLFAIPNGGTRRNAREGARLKAEGVTAGVADLFLAIPNATNSGLFIEMKTEKGRQQDTQKAFEQAVTKQGYRYEVVRSLDQFITLIIEYLNLKNTLCTTR